MESQTEYIVHEGEPSWHQQRAGHPSAASSVWSTRALAEQHAAGLRKHHPALRVWIQERATAFLCSVCGETKPLQHTGGTGYGTDPNTGARVCYACCATRDIASMQEDGRIDLYLSRHPDAGTEALVQDGRGRHYQQGTLPAADWQVTNWPGSLRFRVLRIKRSTGYGFGGSYPRLDVWFAGPGPDGPYLWHAVNAGHHQIARCKRTKERVPSGPSPVLPPNTAPGVLP